MEDLGLVQFTEEGYNGLVLYRVDRNATEVAKIVISLEELGNVLATTPLQFRDFAIREAYNMPSRPGDKIVPFPGSDASNSSPELSREVIHLNEKEIMETDFAPAVACQWVIGYDFGDDDHLHVVMADGARHNLSLGAEAAEYHQGVYTSTLCEMWQGCPVEGFSSGIERGDTVLWNGWRIYHVPSASSYIAIRDDVYKVMQSASGNGEMSTGEMFDALWDGTVVVQV